MSPSPVPVVFDDVAWPDHAWFRSNILLVLSGHAAGVDGTSRSLTRGQDRALLRALRQDAQAIVTGGETVRSEGWHFPPEGFLFVASQGHLPLESCPRIDDLRVFQFMNSGTASLINELTALTRECNIRHLLCESGPSLLRNLILDEVIDEAFVSIAHLPHESAGNESDAENTARHTLALLPDVYVLKEIIHDTGMTYLRFGRRVHRTSPAFITT